MQFWNMKAEARIIIHSNGSTSAFKSGPILNGWQDKSAVENFQVPNYSSSVY